MGSLRSWIKQELLTAGTSRLNPMLRATALLLVLLIGLEGLRRYHTTREQLEQRQREQLQLLQSLVRDNQRPLKDWAQWDEIYAFSEGRQPDFVERLMRTTALLDGGAVMAIHDGQGRLLALEGADRRDRSPSSPLIRCLAGVTQQR
ncbi:MAG: CHASE4 domain-containing protein [Cyanobacteriota bacterium]